jgi:hypothetical protein
LNVRPADIVIEVYNANHTFGYNASMRATYFSNNPPLDYNLDGVAWHRIQTPLPPPGQHPRVMITAGELPDLRKRIRTTTTGRILYNNIKDILAMRLTGGKTSSNCSVASHCSDVVFSLTNRTGAAGPVFDALAKGDISEFSTMTGKSNWTVVTLLMYEGIRCHVEALSVTDPAARKAATAVATIAAQVAVNIAHVMPTTDYRADVQELVFKSYLGHAYDFTATYMNATERATVQKALALSTQGDMWSIGMDGLRPSTDVSNWVPMHLTQLMVNTLALEGEPGYNQALIWRVHAAYERFWQDGVLRDGASFEGLGHNNGMQAQMLLALAKRGSLLFAARSYRNMIRRLYMGVMEPWGCCGKTFYNAAGSWTWDETNGGVAGDAKDADVSVAKYLFPSDPTVDFVYRTSLANYTAIEGKYIAHQFADAWNPFGYLFRLLTVVDWSDQDHTWSEQLALLGSTNSANRTYVFSERGLLAARSDFTRTAAQFLFQPRSVRGGHTLADHGKIALAAHGRWWSPYASLGDTAQHASSSVLLIDDQGSTSWRSRVASTYETGVIVTREAYASTFMTGDARLSYSHPALDHSDSVPINVSSNYFLVDGGRHDDPVYDLPLGLAPVNPLGPQKWNSINCQAWSLMNSAPLPFSQCNWTSSPSTMVRMAYRTAGMVFGPGPDLSKKASDSSNMETANSATHPYVLVADDAQKNDTAVRYSWRMNLASDISPSNVTIDGMDAMLTDFESGDRLLVRTLHAGGGFTWTVTTYNVSNHVANVLTGNVTAVSAELRVLLFPLRKGDPLPQTHWTGGVMGQLLLTKPDGSMDHVTFTPDPSEGYARIAVAHRQE